MKNQKLSDTFNSFERTVRAFGFSDNGGVSNSKQCNMCNRVKILSSIEAVNPKAFLPCLFETGVVTFSFGSEGIDLLERNAVTVNGKPVIIGK